MLCQKGKHWFILQVPTVTRLNSVYNAIGQLIAIFENRDNLKAFNRAYTILTLPLFTSNDIAFLIISLGNADICTFLNKAQSEEYASTGILLPTLFITVKK